MILSETCLEVNLTLLLYHKRTFWNVHKPVDKQTPAFAGVSSEVVTEVFILDQDIPIDKPKLFVGNLEIGEDLFFLVECKSAPVDTTDPTNCDGFLIYQFVGSNQVRREAFDLWRNVSVYFANVKAITSTNNKEVIPMRSSSFFTTFTESLPSYDFFSHRRCV